MFKFVILCAFFVTCKSAWGDNSSNGTGSNTGTKDEISTTMSTTTLQTTSSSLPERSLPICNLDDLKYVYTPCDETGNRWKVQVPQSDTCELKVPEKPQAGVKCTFSCNPGEFLDIETQKCQPCSSGTYSLGDGKRFSTWDSLPEDFDTRGHAINSDQSSQSLSCDQAGWKAKGDYLQSNGTTCRSILRYKVDLVKEGNISFTVRSDDESASFHVWVESSSTCVSTYEPNLISPTKNTDMYYTVTNDWKTHTLDLDQGPNNVYFVATYFESTFDDDSQKNGKSKATFESTAEKSVLIKEIVIRGFSYSQTCEQCEPGTFSGEGSSTCTPCGLNLYSKAGADSCIKCNPEEYAPMQSAKCEERKTCTVQDFHAVYDACTDGKVTKRYEWNEPRICKIEDDRLKPLDQENLPCPACNPGMMFNGTACSYCPPGTMSENIGCKTCPPKTQGVPGLFYNVWTEYPPKPMYLYCIARPLSGCQTVRGWVLHDNYISSGVGHTDDAELLMYISVAEFIAPTSDLLVDFEITTCTSNNCRLKIEMMGETTSTYHILKTYEGTTARTQFRYTRHSQKGTRYRLIFEKMYDENEQTYLNQYAVVNIYKVEVTNAINGGARECVSCEASTSGTCINCPEGQYIDQDKCAKCPKNTYLKDIQNNVGVTSCLSCPQGTVSSPGSSMCHSNCILTLEDKTYNFTSLSGHHLASGSKTFTMKGYAYYHVFNISFCGHPYHPSTCRNNASKADSDVEIVGSICRSTFIPDSETTLSAQSLSVGDALKTISETQRNSSSGLIKELLVTFHSPRRTAVCTSGTQSSIYFVCDPKKDGKGELQVGHGEECKSETCDGCNFVFTWKSRFACPECTKDDYYSLTTGCNNSEKTTHYFLNSSHVCVGGYRKPKSVELECTIFEKSILDLKVAIMGFLLAGVLLAAGVIFLCYRNRSLSYKYHRLVDASQSKDGELPAAETCGDDGDEDEEIILSRGGGGKRILDRIKNIGKNNKENFSEFETINLDSMKNFTDDDDEL